MIARVRSVMAASTAAGSMFSVSRIDVHDHRRRAEVHHDLGGRGEGVGRDDHLVARLQPDGFERQVHRGRRRVDGDARASRRRTRRTRCSKRLVRGPVVSQPPRSVSTTSAISSSSMHGAVERQPGRAERRAAVERQPFRDHRVLQLARGSRHGRHARPLRLAEHHQLVGPQQRDRLQQLAEQPASAGQRPGERRYQRHAASVDGEPGEQGAQLGGSQRTGVPPISRHTEVVGYHEPRPAAARAPSRRATARRMPSSRIEEKTVSWNTRSKRVVLEGQGAGVGLPDVEARLDAPGRVDALRQQIDALPGCSGRRPSSPAAAGSRRRRTRRRGSGTRSGSVEAVPRERRQHVALEVLHPEQAAALEQRVAPSSPAASRSW